MFLYTAFLAMPTFGSDHVVAACDRGHTTFYNCIACIVSDGFLSLSCSLTVVTVLPIVHAWVTPP